MVTRDTTWPGGTPCWVDLGVDDIDKARAFYSGVFGWDIQPGPPEAGGYSIALLRGRPAAGIVRLNSVAPSAVTVRSIEDARSAPFGPRPLSL